MMKVEDFLKTWSIKEGINSIDWILKWVHQKNCLLKVVISKESLDKLHNWIVDDNGIIKNVNGGFFSIGGLKTVISSNSMEPFEQPIIYQNEIGFLGIICKKIKGVFHFLMQAKIEPGNVNKIQISPTIQATKSNFEQKHGGKKPPYLDYFLHANEYEIVVDQIQSEQSSRFYKKRNRNIVINIGETDIDVLPSHCWMTLGQIKDLMKIDNLVNMDTRTVLSCIPFVLCDCDREKVKCFFKNIFMYNSMFNNDSFGLPIAFNILNDYKMFSSSSNVHCSLFDLQKWHFLNNDFCSLEPSNYKVIFCNMEIEGREVLSWDQPLFEASGTAFFGLIVRKNKDKYEFLVSVKPEVGCFDKAEFGPTIQNEPLDVFKMPSNIIERVLLRHLNEHDGILNDVILSEEGGRFYHEQNRNIIIEVEQDEIKQLPPNFVWLDYKTLNLLNQFNNVLNIQLRNLLSLLEI